MTTVSRVDQLARGLCRLKHHSANRILGHGCTPLSSGQKKPSAISTTIATIGTQQAAIKSQPFQPLCLPSLGS
jgi:hypothetical protein